MNDRMTDFVKEDQQSCADYGIVQSIRRFLMLAEDFVKLLNQFVAQGKLARIGIIKSIRFAAFREGEINIGGQRKSFIEIGGYAFENLVLLKLFLEDGVVF